MKIKNKFFLWPYGENAATSGGRLALFQYWSPLLDMPLHKWKVTWNYVSSPFKTHKSIAKNFHSQKLKIVKNNNFITSLYCIIHILLHINNTKVNNTTATYRVSKHFFSMVHVLGWKILKYQCNYHGKNLAMLSFRNNIILIKCNVRNIKAWTF